MKRVLALILAALLLMTPALAVGDGNIDGGGGGLGDGSKDNIWYGDEGVRCTIVDAETGSPAAKSIDLCNQPNYYVSGGQSDPDNPVSISFNIGGSTYSVGNVYYPSGDGQLAWVRWHTPDEPKEITIRVSVSGGGNAQGVITANIIDIDANDPPNPVATDRNDSFTRAAVPHKAEAASASWGIWSPRWHAYWVRIPNWGWVGDEETGGWVDFCWWEDHGWWEFDYNGYTASLSATMRITPDDKSPTASGSTTKSGYGIQQKLTARVTTNQSSSVTAAQNAVTYFPEFGYETYWRLLDRTITGKSSEFQFKPNRYSTYDRRTHFTPIWFPDGAYTPYTWLLDCWTPAGMLSLNPTDSVTIDGNLWEEWHIAPANPY